MEAILQRKINELKIRIMDILLFNNLIDFDRDPPLISGYYAELQQHEQALKALPLIQRYEKEEENQ